MGDNIMPKENTSLQLDTVWYDTYYVACHIGEIGVLGVRFFFLASPVGYV